jgi:HAD superfamily hydrolase (TIGR01509 family)
VLIDSEVIASRAVVAVLAEVGYPIELEAFMRRFVGTSARDQRSMVEAELGRALPADLEERIASRVAAAFMRGLRPMPGIEAALAALPLGRCVASSSRPERLAHTLGLTGLALWFEDSVFSSTMVARGKPAPDLFLLAAERMGIAPARCLVVEDSAPGITGAKAAGMTAFGFAGGSHCAAGHSDRLAAAGADLVFADLALLPGLAAAQRKATSTTS